MVQTSIASWLKISRATSKDAEASCVETNQGVELSEITQDSHQDETQPAARTHQSGEISKSKHVSTVAAWGLPGNVQLVPITRSNVDSFRRLTSLLIPVSYPDSFYRETLEDPVIASLSCAAMWHFDNTIDPTEAAKPQFVAAIRCRVLVSPPGSIDEQTPVLYISTIATLAPFRGHSLATSLLQQVAETARQKYGVSTIMAHVWEANEEAMGWYESRGFKIVGREQGYYRRLAPRTAAWIIRKDDNLQNG